MKFEIALAGISADAYRTAHDAARPEGAEGARGDWPPSHSCARSPTGWIPTRPRSTTPCTCPSSSKGEMGMMSDGRLGAGRHQGPASSSTTILIAPAPQDDGKPLLRAERRCVHLLAAQRSRPAGRPAAAGQAGDGEGRPGRCTRRSPARSRCAPTSTCPAPAGRTASATPRRRSIEAVTSNRVVLSLAHNMAQPNQITAAMIDVITEFVQEQGDHPGAGRGPPRRGRRRRPLMSTTAARRAGLAGGAWSARRCRTCRHLGAAAAHRRPCGRLHAVDDLGLVHAAPTLLPEYGLGRAAQLHRGDAHAELADRLQQSAGLSAAASCC